MHIHTIGFTQKKASEFFSLLSDTTVTMLVDVRLNNRSQLAGFAKRDDLKFFLRELCQTDYVHMPDLAPTKQMLSAYKKGEIPWSEYEQRFLELLAQRHVEKMLSADELDKSCLLCSEHQPHFCHRRLVVEYLNRHWNTTISVTHLV